MEVLLSWAEGDLELPWRAWSLRLEARWERRKNKAATSIIPTSIRVMSAMRRLVIVGLREEEVAVESSRTMRRRTAGIIEGVNGVKCRFGFGKERRCRSR